MRLIVARCSAVYSGRLDTVLPEALRLIMIKADGSVLLHADAGGYKPLNWMTPPTVIEELAPGEAASDESAPAAGDTPNVADSAADSIGAGNTSDAAPDAAGPAGPAAPATSATPTPPTARIIVRKYAGKTEDRLQITLHEVLSDVEHEMEPPDENAGLAKDGVEAHLQELLAEQPHWCGEGLRLVRREWPTDIGPVDLMCRDSDDEWVAVEIKRVAGIDAVEQLTRYLERMHEDPELASCRGVLAAQSIKPQARVLAQSRGIACVEIDLAVLRGEREPELRLFAF